MTQQGIKVDFQSSGDWKIEFSSDDNSLKALQEQVAVQAVRQAMNKFDGDVDRVAGFLDMSRRSIYRYLERGRKIEDHQPGA
jgi:DNA-binding NtrC family response regulator